MATNKDYYDILGVSKGVSDDEIKKAYRKKAREHHPDMVAKEDKAAAENRFKEINEAYQVLSDPQRRKMYDQFGHAGPGFAGADGQEPFGGFTGQWGPFTYTYSTAGSSPFGDFDPLDVFEEVFGFRGFGGSRKPRRGKNLYYEMHLDFAEAVKGVERKIKVESGTVTVKVPAGVRSGTEMRFAGKGVPGPSGTPPGDLLLSVRVSTPRQFQRAGDHLATAIELDFIQAVLGDTIEIPVIDPESTTGVGKAKLKIPSGTQPGSQFRLRGKGMPKLRGHGRGDIVVQVFVKIPQRLSRKQKKLLEEYKNL